MITCDKCSFCSETPGGSLYCAWSDHFVPNIGCENGKPIETAIFDVEETYENCTVQVLKNSVTGEVSVGWWQNDS